MPAPLAVAPPLGRRHASRSAEGEAPPPRPPPLAAPPPAIRTGKHVFGVEKPPKSSTAPKRLSEMVAVYAVLEKAKVFTIVVDRKLTDDYFWDVAGSVTLVTKKKKTDGRGAATGIERLASLLFDKIHQKSAEDMSDDEEESEEVEADDTEEVEPEEKAAEGGASASRKRYKIRPGAARGVRVVGLEALAKGEGMVARRREDLKRIATRRAFITAAIAAWRERAQADADAVQSEANAVAAEAAGGGMAVEEPRWRTEARRLKAAARARRASAALDT